MGYLLQGIAITIGPRRFRLSPRWGRRRLRSGGPPRDHRQGRSRRSAGRRRCRGSPGPQWSARVRQGTRRRRHRRRAHRQRAGPCFPGRSGTRLRRRGRCGRRADRLVLPRARCSSASPLIRRTHPPRSRSGAQGLRSRACQRAEDRRWRSRSLLMPARCPYRRPPLLPQLELQRLLRPSPGLLRLLRPSPGLLRLLLPAGRSAVRTLRPPMPPLASRPSRSCRR
jgi:hypothetical protein